MGKKIGSERPDIGVPKLRVQIPLAYDSQGTYRKELQKIVGISSVGVSSVFLIDGSGIIVWREIFGQMYLPAHGHIESQVRRLKSNQRLVSIGDKPEVDEEELEEWSTPSVSEDSD